MVLFDAVVQLRYLLESAIISNNELDKRLTDTVKKDRRMISNIIGINNHNPNSIKTFCKFKNKHTKKIGVMCSHNGKIVAATPPSAPVMAGLIRFQNYFR